MKRYELEHRSRGMEVHTDIEENPLGDFVKFEDAETEIARLTAEIDDLKRGWSYSLAAIEAMQKLRPTLPDAIQMLIVDACRTSRCQCFCGCHVGATTAEFDPEGTAEYHKGARQVPKGGPVTRDASRNSEQV